MTERYLNTFAQMTYACAKKNIDPILTDAKKEGRTYDSVVHEVHERLAELSHLELVCVSSEDSKIILALTRSGVIDLLDFAKEDYLKKDEKIAIEDNTDIVTSEDKATKFNQTQKHVYEIAQEDVSIANDKRMGGIMEF